MEPCEKREDHCRPGIRIGSREIESWRDGKPDQGATDAGHLTISSLKQDIEAAREKVAAEFREKLAGGERAVASLKQRYAGVEESLRADRGKNCAERNPARERNAEEARLRGGLAESQKSLARSGWNSMPEIVVRFRATPAPPQASTGPESVAPQGHLDATRTAIATEFNDKIAAGEIAIAVLKQQHSSAMEHIARDHEVKPRQRKRSSSSEAQLQDFAALEKQMPASAGHALGASPSNQPATTIAHLRRDRLVDCGCALDGDRRRSRISLVVRVRRRRTRTRQRSTCRASCRKPTKSTATWNMDRARSTRPISGSTLI